MCGLLQTTSSPKVKVSKKQIFYVESNTAEAEGYVDHYGRQKKLTTLIRVDIWTPLYVVNHSSLRNTVD